MYKYEYLKRPDIKVRCNPWHIFVINRRDVIDELLIGYDREIQIKERQHYVSEKLLEIESYIYVKIKEPATKDYPIVVASFYGCDAVEGIVIGRLDIINKVFDKNFYLVTIRKELIETIDDKGEKVYAFKKKDNLFKKLYKLLFKPFSKS